eukprot:PhF_6_TR12295/c2_g1_i2/m.19521
MLIIAHYHLGTTFQKTHVSVPTDIAKVTFVRNILANSDCFLSWLMRGCRCRESTIALLLCTLICGVTRGDDEEATTRRTRLVTIPMREAIVVLAEGCTTMESMEWWCGVCVNLMCGKKRNKRGRTSTSIVV